MKRRSEPVLELVPELGNPGRAVEAALRHEFAGRYSSSQIARHVGVSHTFVDNLRTILQPLQDTSDRLVTRNGQTYTMNTANIGRNGATPPQPALLRVKECCYCY